MMKLMFVHYTLTYKPFIPQASKHLPRFLLCIESLLYFLFVCVRTSLCCTWVPMPGDAVSVVTLLSVSPCCLSLVIGRSPHDTRPPASAICLRGFHDITHNSRWWSNSGENYPVNTGIMSHSWFKPLIAATYMFRQCRKNDDFNCHKGGFL